MDDKVFNLLEKMYVEFTEFKQEVNQRFNSMDSRFDTVESRLTKLESTLENVTNKKIDVALEGYTSNSEKLNTIDYKIEDMASTVTNIEIITSKNWNDIAILKKAK
jgi:archaellum component FlaC